MFFCCRGRISRTTEVTGFLSCANSGTAAKSARRSRGSRDFIGSLRTTVNAKPLSGKAPIDLVRVRKAQVSKSKLQSKHKVPRLRCAALGMTEQWDLISVLLCRYFGGS